MQQVIHFKTKLFDVSKEPENPINPIYGVSLLNWFLTHNKNDFFISTPEPEDWGWYSEVTFNGQRYLIGANAQFEDGDNPKELIE